MCGGGGSRRHGKSGEGVCSRVGMGLAGYKKGFQISREAIINPSA